MGEVLMRRAVPGVPGVPNECTTTNSTSLLVLFTIRGSRKLIRSGRT